MTVVALGLHHLLHQHSSHIPSTDRRCMSTGFLNFVHVVQDPYMWVWERIAVASHDSQWLFCITQSTIGTLCHQGWIGMILVVPIDAFPWSQLKHKWPIPGLLLVLHSKVLILRLAEVFKPSYSVDSQWFPTTSPRCSVTILLTSNFSYHGWVSRVEKT